MGTAPYFPRENGELFLIFHFQRSLREVAMKSPCLILGAALLLAAAAPSEDAHHTARREAMVKSQIAARGVTDPAVLRAMATVRRHLFVPEASLADAYDDRPLPIGSAQTISHPTS